MELAGRNALVTGGAHRVGKALSVALAAAGCNVAIHFGRSSGPAEQTADEIRALGVDASLVQSDLSDPAGAANVIERAAGLGPLSVLVNSAAGFPADFIADLTLNDLHSAMSINLYSPVMLTQAFAAQVPEQTQGAVINVTDWKTARPYRTGRTSYTLAKGALDTFTKVAAVELGPRIRVNAVALGAILPPPGEDDAYLKQITKKIPAGQPGNPDVVAEAMLSLLRNDYVTGETIRVAGGAHLV